MNEIAVRGRDSDHLVQPMEIIGFFAVHQSVDAAEYFTCTHIPSGMAAGWPWQAQVQVRRIAYALSVLPVHWEDPDPSHYKKFGHRVIETVIDLATQIDPIPEWLRSI